MDSSTSTPTFPHRSSNTSTSTTAGTTSTGTSNNSNCRIRPRQEYGSTMDDNPSEATTATPAATNCNRVRCISEDSNSIISNSIISNSNNNYSLGTRNNRLRSASASSVVSVASLASSKCAANNQNQTHQQQHQQQKRRAAAAASPIPKSSKSEVMILLKRLFIRCFMTRRKRRRRVLATRKIKKNSFQSADDNDNDKANSNSNSNNTGNNTSRGIHLEAQEAQQLRSSSKPYSAIPCNETEMYLMLRSKRTNTTLGGADRNHHRSHSNSHSLPMVGTKSYDSNNTYNSSMGHYRASQSTPLGDRHLRRRTSSAESNKPRRQTTARPSSIAVTRKRSSTIGTTTPSHIFIERQEPRHIVNENEKENDIHIDVDVDIEPLSSFS